eukprot:COSAG01_NODE_2229_length_8129_cov_27.374595_7_plen_38_part_00
MSILHMSTSTFMAVYSAGKESGDRLSDYQRTGNEYRP